PGAKLPVESAALTLTIVALKAPAMAVPLPALAGLAPIDHSAAAMFEPPESESVTVAVRVAPDWLLIGLGSDWIEPATIAGPAWSPPARWIAKLASLRSAPLKLGVPLSVSVTRTSAWSALGTLVRSQV